MAYADVVILVYRCGRYGYGTVSLVPLPVDACDSWR